MKYTVIVTPEAESNILGAFEHIAGDSPANANCTKPGERKWPQGTLLVYIA